MVIGFGINELIKNKEYYDSISDMIFIKYDIIYKIIGIKYIKWLVYKTFWNNFNPKLRIDKRPYLSELKLLKQEMIYAEISHLIGFIFTLIISLIGFYYIKIEFGVILISTNTFFNLYPILLQQLNKNRIDKLIKSINQKHL